MHELSLAHELLKKLCSLAEQHHAGRILEVKVAIGPLSGIVADSFRFGFEALAPANSVTRGAALLIDSPPPSYKCIHCGNILESQKTHPGYCHKCNRTNFMPCGGDELLLLQIKIE
jgi:hydrogenase nickel incorporation protein HypA/HybF